jgi:protease-4
VLSAVQALEAGLIDGLGSLDDATEVAAELAGLQPDAYEVISIEPAVTPRQLLLQQLSDTFGVVLAQPATAAFDHLMARVLALFGSGQAASQITLFTQPDPRNLYMHCLPCAAAL